MTYRYKRELWQSLTQELRLPHLQRCGLPQGCANLILACVIVGPFEARQGTESRARRSSARLGEWRAHLYLRAYPAPRRCLKAPHLAGETF